MKKTLIASAVAAATLSSFAMAEAKLPTIYGSIQLVSSNVDVDGGTNIHEFRDTGSTLGLTHSHELDSGTTVFMKAELEFRADEDHYSMGFDEVGNPVMVKDNGVALDEAYVGISGGFGSLQVGKDETVYDWIDVVDLSDEFGLGGGIAIQKEGDNFQYVLDANENLKLGATLPLDSDTNFGGALAAMYTQDAVTVAFSYALGRKEAGVDVGDTIGLGGSIGLGDFAINAQFESRDLTAAEEAADMIENYGALQGVYTMGANVMRLGYGMGESKMTDVSDIELAFIHNLSDNAYVYIETLFRNTDPDGGKDTDDVGYALGVTYSF